MMMMMMYMHIFDDDDVHAIGTCLGCAKMEAHGNLCCAQSTSPADSSSLLPPASSLPCCWRSRHQHGRYRSCGSSNCFWMFSDDLFSPFGAIADNSLLSCDL